MKRKSVLAGILGFLLVSAMLVFGNLMLQMRTPAPQPPSLVDTTADSYARNRVVMLKTDLGQCTGVIVRGRSGLTYTLTAGHCKDMLDKEHADSIAEDGTITRVSFIALDTNSDLMLLTTSGIPGQVVDVADHIYRYENVHTMTHGGGVASYRTDGALLEFKDVHFVAFFIDTDKDEAACKAGHNQSVERVGIFVIACVKTYRELIASAAVIPGSSGGPLLDASNKLVGIASVSFSGTQISGFVPLAAIKRFLYTR